MVRYFECSGAPTVASDAAAAVPAAMCVACIVRLVTVLLLLLLELAVLSGMQILLLRIPYTDRIRAVLAMARHLQCHELHEPSNTQTLAFIRAGFGAATTTNFVLGLMYSFCHRLFAQRRTVQRNNQPQNVRKPCTNRDAVVLERAIRLSYDYQTAN